MEVDVEIYLNLGPISVMTKTEFSHLVGALMEHFLEGIVPL